jgi:carbon-monoxide dehydrogenase large subunit
VKTFKPRFTGEAKVGDIEVAFKNDGTVTGLRYNVYADLGSYHQLLTPAIPTLTGLMLSGAYKIPAIQINITACFTNKMATDAYRGAGRPEATYVVERAMDLVAADLNKDPADVRRKNFPAANEFPFHTATGLDYDSGNYEAALDKAQGIADYAKLRAEQKAARADGRLIGIGISTYVEICALGPSQAMPAGGWESATVRIEPTGKVTVLTGASPHGQGQETSFAQIAADELGVDMNDVTVIHGDTGVVQYGIGHSAVVQQRSEELPSTLQFKSSKRKPTRSQPICFRPMRRAFRLKVEGIRCEQPRLQPLVVALNQSFPLAKHLLQHYLNRRPEGKSSLTIQEIALAAHLAKELPPDTEPGLSATYFFEPKNFTFPFGTHIAVVEVDRDTGDIKFLRYVAVDDCGKVINPMLVDGQVHGGIVQSIGQAMFEEVVYDEQGQLITGTLMDYALPRASHIPNFELDRTETPSPVNPLGVKGVGEAGNDRLNTRNRGCHRRRSFSIWGEASRHAN